MIRHTPPLRTQWPPTTPTMADEPGPPPEDKDHVHFHQHDDIPRHAHAHNHAKHPDDHPHSSLTSLRDALGDAT